ncbi:MAG: DUF3137 domain-containing protein [Acholeplasmataceae bacterium]
MFEYINQQKRIYKRKMKIGFFISILSFVLFFPMVLSLGIAGFFIISFPFLGGFIYAGMNGGKINQLSQTVKSEYVLPELKKMIPNATYRMHDGFTELEVVNSGLLRHQDRFHSEDMIEGTLDGIDFKCSDVKQEDVSTDSKGHTHTTTVFEGRFYQFDFPKTFEKMIVITQHHPLSFINKHKLVETESIKFNSELSVYSEDKQAAFYLLTPAFMEKLMRLDETFKDRVSLSFIENKLYIAINNGKNAFEIPLNKDVDDSLFIDYQEEISHIKMIIETLSL